MSANRILVVAGSATTSTNHLVARTAEVVKQLGLEFLLLGPNRQLAERYPDSAKSIYTWIYNLQPEEDEGMLVHPLADNADSESVVYIVGDCHLVSDSKFESDYRRWGSGRLLQDFLEFVDLPLSQRKVVFVGDPFQLVRGRKDEIPLSEAWLSSRPYAVEQLALGDVVPDQPTSALIANRVMLSQMIRRRRFNHLRLVIDDLQCTRMPSDPDQRRNLISDLMTSDPYNTKVVAYTHDSVNRINRFVREHTFGRQGELTEGDLVVTDNSFIAERSSPCQAPSYTYIPNGSFGEIMKAGYRYSHSQLDSETQKPVKVDLQPIEVKWSSLDGAPVTKGLCIPEYLRTEKPGLPRDKMVALLETAKGIRSERGHATMKACQWLASDKSSGAECGCAFERGGFALCFTVNPYLNAAQLRFGFALTVHKAQGLKIGTVIACLTPPQEDTNVAYARWLYTAFTVPTHRMYLGSIPIVHPLMHAKWKPESALPGTVQRANQVLYDPDKEEDAGQLLKFPIPELQLRNLYRHIKQAVENEGHQIVALQHRQYQEQYVFSGSEGKQCKLLFIYNGRYQVTHIQVAQAMPQGFAKEILSLLTGGLLFENDLQQELYEAIGERLQVCGIEVPAIEHHLYQEVYFVKGDCGRARLAVYYDGKGFVTTVQPLVYSHPAVLDAVKFGLGF